MREAEQRCEMWSFDSEPDNAAGAAAITTASSSTCSSNPSTPPLPSPPQPPPRCHKNTVGAPTTGREAVAEDVWHGPQWETAWPQRPKPVVVAAEETDSTSAASSPCGGDGVGRARSLTDDDLEELKGCADLGFGFSYDEIPELRGTFPALELCYSMTMSQRFLDQPQTPQEQETATATPTSMTTSPPIANWKISSPGDSTEEVKARLK